MDRSRIVAIYGSPARPQHALDLARLIADGLGHLLRTMEPDHPARLWASQGVGETTDPLAVQHGAEVYSGSSPAPFGASQMPHCGKP